MILLEAASPGTIAGPWSPPARSAATLVTVINKGYDVKPGCRFNLTVANNAIYDNT